MRLRILVAVAVLAFSASMFADNAVVTFTNNGQEDNTYYNLAGFDFTNSEPLLISALGVEACGTYCGHLTLVDSHFVGIYNQAGNSLQVSTTVAAGSPTDANGFAYTSLGSTYLLPVGTWFIGVQYNQGSPDWKWTGDGNITMGPDITFDATHGFFNITKNVAVSTSDPASATFDYQQAFSGQGGRDSYISANFQYTPTPEPSSLLLLGSGLLGLAGAVRRKVRL